MHIQKVFWSAAILLLTSVGGAARPEPVTSSSLKIEGIATHPAMALTPGAIEHGRENYRTYDWAREIGDKMTSAAAQWLGRDAKWIQDHTPGAGACFAYGFAGCPECGGKTGYWAASICSFENPGSVKCVNGHTLPNEKYPDAGEGYKAPDGRLHYFVGTYNSWVVEQYISGALDLAYAYSLTGEDRYASKAAEILDALADIYPTCTIGSWDYPETRPGQNSGRFNRPQYQVGRVLINLANTYDQIFNSPSLQQPSVRSGLRRQQNIERNMLQDGAWYCYEKSFNFSGLHNGSADYIKGAMVVGLVLGIPEYVRWAVDGPYGIKAMLANNVGRDGTYYETATGYSYYTRFIYRGYAEYLLNYRGSAYPDGVNLYENDRFRNFMLLLNLNTQLGGMMPSYGDAAPISSSWTVEEKPFEKYDFECLEYLRCRATDPAERARYEIIQNWLSDGEPEKLYADSLSWRWFLFHGKPLDESLITKGPADYIGQVKYSHVLGQKGMAMLRTGWGPGESQGVLLRYGPALNHANLDDLNFTYHALGHDLTYDLGYALGSAHVYTGWSKQTASHQLVTVNEKSQMLEGAPTGGSLRLFAQGDLTQFAEASAPAAYKPEGVQEYARTLFLVNDPQKKEDVISGVFPPAHPYLLDIFRVAGGTQHDSFSHAAGTSVTFGLAEVAEPTTGSLAGEKIAWGDKVLVDGDISGQSNKPYWVAPPGNGYGFLMEPRTLSPTGSCWWADWQLPESTDHVRLWFPAVKEEKALSAWGPGILKNLPDAAYVVRRRTAEDGAANAFVTLWEPYTTTSLIRSVELIPLENDARSSWPAVAVRVTFTDGRTDLLYSAGDDVARKVDDTTIAARMARVSFVDDKMMGAEAVGLTEFQAKAGATVRRGSDFHAGRITGAVTSVDPEKGIIETSLRLPGEHSMDSQMIMFNNSKYSRNTAYEIASVERFSTGTLIQLTESCVLGQGLVASVDPKTNSIASLVSHEYAKGVLRSGESGFFKGKTIVNPQTGASTRIKSNGIKQPMELEVESADGFAAGDTFNYYDIAAGDEFEIVGYARWR